jgi:DNA invertase Pin-like site-specific DNA recombinase
MNQPKYVIYARKSTESDDRQVLSIQSQINELQRIAAREGITVSEILTESKSAKAPGRPVFGSLMRRIDRDEIRGVLCWKMDRLARNHLDTGRILQALADGSLERIITSDGTKTSDSNDRFMGSFEFAVATKFIDDLRANIMRGHRARAERGWSNGVAALGYLNDRLTKTTTVDPDRFDLVQRMWGLALQKTPLVEILRVATEQWGLRRPPHGKHAGGPLSLSGLYRLLQNPFYMGMIRKGTKLGAHRPMVSREEFERVQEIIRRKDRGRRKHLTFRYAGLFRCGSCGRMMSGERHLNPNGTTYVYYRCSGGHWGKCRERAVREPWLEAELGKLLGRLRIPEPVMEFLRKHAAAGLGQERNRREAVLNSLRAAIAASQREEDNLLSLRLRDVLDDARFLERQQAIKAERLKREQHLARVEGAAAAPGEDALKTLEFARAAHAAFVSGTVFQRRAILQAVCAKSTVRSRKLALEFKIPFQLVASAGGIGNFSSLVSDVRKWLDEKTEYFALPKLDAPIAPEISRPFDGAIRAG